MPAESSADPGALRPAIDISTRGRLAMVALGYLPFLHACASVVGIAFVAFRNGPVWAIAVSLVAVYLVPPLAARAARPKAKLTAERYPVDAPGFLRWWYTAQCQILFNRLPFLEELLRLVPGLYSAWLRLWGARVGSFVYWSPGIDLFDRSFLEIGDRVVIGATTKICPHLLTRSPDGKMQLVLSPITIGHDAMIGGSTLLPAGVRVEPCEQTPGFKPMAPFALFHKGRHIRTTRFRKDATHD